MNRVIFWKVVSIECLFSFCECEGRREIFHWCFPHLFSKVLLKYEYLNLFFKHCFRFRFCFARQLHHRAYLIAWTKFRLFSVRSSWPITKEKENCCYQSVWMIPSPLYTPSQSHSISSMNDALVSSINALLRREVYGAGCGK